MPEHQEELPLEVSQPDSPLQHKLAHLPDSPGVYLYKNIAGDILYVGKSISLRNRVRSYFHRSAKHNLRIQIMVSLIHDVSLIVTDTEAEALILEEQLIKTHRPRYNVALKDDKSYPYCKLSVNEDFPRVFLVREKHDPSAEYYGPYPSVRDARKVLRTLNHYFQLRTSKMKLDGSKTYRPCLNFQLKRCLAPCQGNVDSEAYQEAVSQVRLFLKGKDQELFQNLEQRMDHAAKLLQFEKAAQFRDQIYALKRIFARQTVLTPNGDDQDIFNLYRESDDAGIQVLFIRNGRLLGNDFFFFRESEQASDDNVLGQVLHRIYMNEAAEIPKQIILPFLYSDQEALEAALCQKSGKRIELLVPQRGQKKELVTMAYKNARLSMEEHRSREDHGLQVLQKVQKELHLKSLPNIVEAFDISHLAGSFVVASMVCWKDNKACKSRYRKYKIQQPEGSDDFASMEEVLTRRYQMKHRAELPLPDLILIDGGKGQLARGVEVLRRLSILDEVDVIGLAKGRSELKRTRKSGRRRTAKDDVEYVVKPNRKNEIRLNQNSAVLYFLQNIRDESHRFAIEFQRQLKRKDNLHSVLDDIPGVGSNRKKSLLKHFGSLKKIQTASYDELCLTSGISKEIAKNIYEFFQKKG